MQGIVPYLIKMRVFSLLPLLRTGALFQNFKMFVRGRTKTIVGDKIHPLTENTLLGRMLIYLNDSPGKDLMQKHNGTNIINNLAHGRTSGLRTLSVDQIAGLFYSVNTNILVHNKRNMQRMLDLLDVECCLRINAMNPQQLLKVLGAFMHVVPNRITKYRFYQYATENIVRCLSDISKKELLQFIFYIGLQKETKKAQVILKKCLRSIQKDFLENLTIEDLCIICNSTYRTNTKINSFSILQKVKQTLNENLILLKDPALLITLLKTIKHNHCGDEDLFSTISCTIFFNNTIKCYTFTAICHILALYADHLYYDEQLLTLLTTRGIEQLKSSTKIVTKNMYLSEQLRAKDITTFLWALSMLGYTEIDQRVLEEVFLPKIKERIAIGEYRTASEILIDGILYMWMLGYHPVDLISYALSKENIAPLKANHGNSRLRLNLLLTCIRYEAPDLYKDLAVKPVGTSSFNQNSHIQNRPLLHRVFDAMNAIAPDLNIQVKTTSQIPYLNIVGITGYDDQMRTAVNIEVLDDYVCVKNKDCHPSGFMQLKLRILDRLEVPLVIIEQSQVHLMTDTELQVFLKEEVKLIC